MGGKQVLAKIDLINALCKKMRNVRKERGGRIKVVSDRLQAKCCKGGNAWDKYEPIDRSR